MSKPKITPFYPPHIKPVRVGWYETRASRGITLHYRAYWDGLRWRHAPLFGGVTWPICSDQNRKWCGLARKAS